MKDRRIWKKILALLIACVMILTDSSVMTLAATVGSVIEKQNTEDEDVTENTEEETQESTPETNNLLKSRMGGLPEGRYGNYNFSYNTVKDAFTTSAYEQYYNADSPLGIAGSFHVVAFDTANLNAHTNGNVLAHILNAGSNFGTNNYTNELSYVQYYNQINSSSASQSGHVLVLGSDNVIDKADNGNALSVNGTKIDRPYNFVQDTDTANAPFIDLEKVKEQISGISAELANVATVGVTADFQDQNNRRLTLTDPDAAGYYNMTAGELEQIKNNPLKLMGFQKGHKGSIIINVDCAGVSEVYMPQKATIFIDGNEQSTSEVTTFENGKVIWNFINAGGVTINTQQMTGMVVAPGATVNAVSNLNGTIVAENVNIKAETHRTDFTGTTIPATAKFDAEKTVDGKEPEKEQVFHFVLEELSGGKWVEKETVANEGKAITFSTFSYGKDSDVGTHWYRIYEKTTENAKYIMDSAQFVVKVDVTKNGNMFSAEKTYYKVNNSDELISSGSINMGQVTPADGAEFNNKELIDISGTKTWAGVPEGITKPNVTIKLFQNGKYLKSTTLENDRYSFTDLEKCDANGEEYNYTVEEEMSGANADNFTGSKSENDFINTYNNGSLKLVKTFAGDLEEAELTDAEKEAITFKVTGPHNYNKSVTYDLFTDGTYTLGSLPVGTYTVTETIAAVEGYSVVTTYSVEDGKTAVAKDQTTELTITNTYTEDKGSLRIVKSFAGDLEEADFTDAEKEAITFKVTGPHNYNKSVTYDLFTDGTYTLSNLPVGTYTVTETNAAVEGYSVVTTYSVEDGKTAVAKDETAELTITNTYTEDKGNLKVTKAFAGDELTAEQKNAINFTVTGPNDYSETKPYGEFENGSWIIENLPVGQYTVKETNAAVPDYSVETTYSVEDGKTAVVKDQTAEVVVTNTYTQHKGSLVLTKSFAGDLGEADLTDVEKKAITFEVTGPHDYRRELTYDQFKNRTYTLSDLAVGEYTVTETKTGERDGYHVAVSYSVTDGKTQVVKDGRAEVEITNTYSRDVGKLVVKKSFKGAELTEEQKGQILFTVKGPNGYTARKTYAEFEEGSWIIENLPVGEYTVKESNAAIAGYSVEMKYSVKDGKAVLTHGETVEVEITNTYSRDKGSLTVNKSFVGDLEETELTDTQKEGIVFTVTGPDHFRAEKAYSEFEDGSWTLTDLPTGEYRVVESNAEVEGYEVETAYSVANGLTTLIKDQEAQVIVTNTYTYDKGSLKLVKSFAGDLGEADLTDAEKEAITFKVTGPHNYNKSVTYDLFTDRTYTLSNLPVGAYTVEETNATVKDYSVVTTYSVEEGKTAVAKDETAELTITNTYTHDKGSLKVTKAFAGDELTDEQKNAINFTVTGPNDYSETKPYGEFENGSWIIENLPVGQYTVKETNAAVPDYSVETTYSVEGGKTAVVKDQTSEVMVTNTYTQHKGSLELIKTFAGTVEDKDLSEEQKEAIVFMVTGPDDYSREIKYSDFTNGTYTLFDLPVGEYTVTEVQSGEVNGNHATVSYSVTDGKTQVVEDGKAEVTVTNTYSKSVGNLVVKKSFAGAELTEEQKGQILFTVTGPNDYTASKSYAEFEDGSWTIENLPVGEYTVKESNAAITGYSVETKYSVEDGKAVLTHGKTAEIEITNTYSRDKASLTVTKSFAGNELTDEQKKSITFTVTGPEGYTNSRTYGDFEDGKWTLTDLPTGEYRVTENNADVEGYEVETVYSVANGLTTLIKDQDSQVNVTNTYRKIITVKVSKVDITDSKEVAGATMQILDKDGGIVKEWISKEGGAEEITGITPDEEYTLRETVAPKDYSVITQDIKFTVDKDGKITVTSTGHIAGKDEGTVVDNILLVKDGKEWMEPAEVGSLKIVKEFAGDELTDAQKAAISFTVTGPEDYHETIHYNQFIDGSLILDELVPGEYTITETNEEIPGYSVETKYSVEDGKVVIASGKFGEVTVTNTYTQDKGNIEITKVFAGDVKDSDLTAEQKAKITFTVTGPNGFHETKTYDQFTDGKWILGDLPTGEYRVSESNADVESYDVQTTYSVANGLATLIKNQTTQVNVTNTYEKNTVSLKVSKVDIADGREVAGATLQVVDKDGNIIKEWTSKEGGAEEITGLLPDEEYTIRETTAPFGYEKITKEISFTVDKEGKITVTDTGKVNDKDEGTVKDNVLLVNDLAKLQGGSLKVRKVLKLQGEVVMMPATFEIGLFTDKEGTNLYRKETFDMTEGPAEVTFENLPEGVYYVYELDINGNAITGGKGLAGTLGEFDFEATITVSRDGKVELQKGQKDDDPVVVVNDYPDLPDGYTKVNIEISGTKTWVDDNDSHKVRPDNLILTLNDGTQDIELQSNDETAPYYIEWSKPESSNEWTYTIKNVPKVDDDGNLIEYTVTEEIVDHYESESDITSGERDGDDNIIHADFKNTYEEESTTTATTESTKATTTATKGTTTITVNSKEVKESGKSSGSAKTGDTTDFMLYLLLLATASVFGVNAWYTRKKTKTDK